MPEIAIKTMVIAIQAVAAQVKALRIAAAEDIAGSEDLALLEGWEAAADDLERAYGATACTVINLPPYEELTRG